MFKKVFFLLMLVALSCSKETIETPTLVDPVVPESLIVKCENGMAGIYPCNDYDLLAQISLEDLDPTATVSSNLGGNDSWGWTDATTTKEYVLMGLNSGVSFVDISNPTVPIVLGFLPTATVNSDWRDVKVYNNHAFVVSEAANHGMQVFDLTRLRNVANPPEIFTAETTLTDFGNAHNIVINEASGYAYAVGTSQASGGPLFINIQNPINPVIEGSFSEGGYSHDAQVVNYNGPDADYASKEIMVSSNGERFGTNEVVIVDVTDKNNPVEISKITYANEAYTHQGWFTEDQRYFIVGDELDEVEGKVDKTRILIFDLLDLDNPVLSSEYFGPTEAIDHNGYVKENTYYQANYTAGVRMIDITDVSNKNLNEIAFFDTHPENNNTSFQGAWNVYPYFTSNVIVVSDIERGLFLVKKSE
ncbi:choice-of-anchor B family protein [Polaribacter sp. Hel_I_88]|uniref:choice-of-anchor B family protein n=1 Tax=Polaribacter sp. Hel_I_88 TaxID=1250006 RepID=UPI00047D214D|nr:choice-of-anchor B family protein [Polaribacter sp. Hel_I_88]